MLCENCQQSALNDDSPIFQVETDDAGHRSLVTDENAEITTNFFLVDHFPELPSLRESARSGCEFCSFLRQSLLSDDVANCLHIDYGLDVRTLDEDIVLQIRYRWNCLIDDTIFKNLLQVIGEFANTAVQFGIVCNIRAAHKDDPVAKWLCLDGPSNQAFTSTKTIRWMRKHISECQKHHHELATPNFVPRLLLDVRGKTPKLTDQDTFISSCKTRGQLKNQTPRYAALSYCWGTADDAKAQLKTTRASYAIWQAGIETGKITPVLQDAILVTRKLSIPYLWVDSLCIFQDDIADWNRQCTEMDKIYGHAEVTIVAAASTSCGEGFLQRRATRVQLPFRSTFSNRVQGSMWIELRSVNSNPGYNSADVHVDFDGSRLATRGWAVQERVLSTRQIVFGKLNVHFICPWNHQSVGEPLVPTPYHSTIHRARVERNVQGLYSHWTHLLGAFSDITATSFTRATDLLPSMSGMAADFAKRLEDDYFAGHWGNDLVLGLMWSQDLSFKVSKTVRLDHICSPTQYLVPSWSQLSMPGGKSLLRNRSDIPSYQAAVEYIGAHTTLNDENNAFGAINSGELRVRGYSMRFLATDGILVKSVEPVMENWARQTCRWLVTFERFDAQDLRCEVRLDYNLRIAEIDEEVKLWKWILLGTCKIPSRRARTEDNKDDEGYPFGLLVHRIRGSEWCRIGVFEPHYEPQGARLSPEVFRSEGKLEDITII